MRQNPDDQECDGQPEPAETDPRNAHAERGEAEQDHGDDHENQLHARAVPGTGHVQAVGRRVVRHGGAWTVRS